MVLFLCISSNWWFIFEQSLMKIFLTVLSYRMDTIFIGKISKGHNSVKM